jgi:hypothetical protein
VRVRVVAGVLVALVAAGLLAVLSHVDTRVAGTNHVRLIGLNVTLPAGATACQPGTALAAHAGAARMTVGTYGRPSSLTLRFVAAGGAVQARGHLPLAVREGVVTIPFARPVGDRGLVGSACIHNDGNSKLVLGGDLATPANAARVGGTATHGVVAFTYLRAGRTSWWPLMDGIAHRFGIGKVSFLGAWALWACAALLLALWVATLRLLIRELPR